MMSHNLPLCSIVNDDRCFSQIPSVLVLNPTSLAKAHAIEHLTVDLKAYNIDIAIISESWFKAHHSDSLLSISGYILYRRDRPKRRGGGVCIYINSLAVSARVHPLGSDGRYEVIWVRTAWRGHSLYVAALY